MNTLEILLGWLVTNAVAALLLLCCWRLPSLGRAALAAVFLVAAVVNACLGVRHPEAYVDFARHAIPPYGAFIKGPFSARPDAVILPIAAGQLIIAYLLSRDGAKFRVGVAGAIVFLVAVAPLGLASAFPSTIVLAFAAGLLLRRHARPFFHDFFPSSPAAHALRHFPQ